MLLLDLASNVYLILIWLMERVLVKRQLLFNFVKLSIQVITVSVKHVSLVIIQVEINAFKYPHYAKPIIYLMETVYPAQMAITLILENVLIQIV